MILKSSSKSDLERMVAECIESFREVGLEVGAAQTHWTCWPAAPADILHAVGMGVVLGPHLVFIGGVVNFIGGV
eukprot:3748326-Lingulodinium_polyedra.AAC.1